MPPFFSCSRSQDGGGEFHLHVSTPRPYGLVEHLQADGALKGLGLLLLRLRSSLQMQREADTFLVFAGADSGARLPPFAA